MSLKITKGKIDPNIQSFIGMLVFHSAQTLSFQSGSEIYNINNNIPGLTLQRGQFYALAISPSSESVYAISCFEDGRRKTIWRAQVA